MSEKTIASARRRRGILRGRLTRIGRDIAKLEEKEELGHQDQRKVERLMEQVKENDAEFEQRHLDVIDFIEEEDADTLTREETVFDKHVDIVAELVERIERLTVPKEAASAPTMPMAPDLSGKLAKRLKFIEQQGEAIAIFYAVTAFWD